MIKVLLVNGTTLSRKGLRTLLEKSKTIDTIVEATTADDAIEEIPKLNPELVLVDLSKPELNGVDIVRRIHTAHPTIQILVLSISTASQHVFDCLKAGASGYMSSDAPFAELLTAIQKVLTEGGYLG